MLIEILSTKFALHPADASCGDLVVLADLSSGMHICSLVQLKLRCGIGIKISNFQVCASLRSKPTQPVIGQFISNQYCSSTR